MALKVTNVIPDIMLAEWRTRVNHEIRSKEFALKIFCASGGKLFV